MILFCNPQTRWKTPTLFKKSPASVLFNWLPIWYKLAYHYWSRGNEIDLHLSRIPSVITERAVGAGGTVWRRKAGCFRDMQHTQSWYKTRLKSSGCINKCIIACFMARGKISWKAGYGGELSGLWSLSPSSLPGAARAVPCGRRGDAEPPFLSTAGTTLGWVHLTSVIRLSCTVQ